MRVLINGRTITVDPQGEEATELYRTGANVVYRAGGRTFALPADQAADAAPAPKRKPKPKADPAPFDLDAPDGGA